MYESDTRRERKEINCKWWNKRESLLRHLVFGVFFFSPSFFFFFICRIETHVTHKTGKYIPRFHLFISCMTRKCTKTKDFTERWGYKEKEKNTAPKRRRIWIETKADLNKHEHVSIRVENGQCEIVNWFVVRWCESNFVIAKLNRQLHEKTQQLAIEKRKPKELNTYQIMKRRKKGRRCWKNFSVRSPLCHSSQKALYDVNWRINVMRKP